MFIGFIGKVNVYIIMNKAKILSKRQIQRKTKQYLKNCLEHNKHLQEFDTNSSKSKAFKFDNPVGSFHNINPVQVPFPNRPVAIENDNVANLSSESEDCSSDIGSNENEYKATDITQTLRNWAVAENVTSSSLNNLLKILHKSLPYLPLDIEVC